MNAVKLAKATQAERKGREKDDNAGRERRGEAIDEKEDSEGEERSRVG